MFTIVLAGGSGTRLFPLSRSNYPKQFLPLLDNESLFQKTIRRALLFSSPGEIFIVTNNLHKYHVRNQIQKLGVECNILTEPCGKNTLPAILYAINEIKQRSVNSPVLVFPSDHLLVADEEYKSAVIQASRLSKSYIVTFGVNPTSPHTGYGYIKPGNKLDDGYEVDSFVEKPDLETALTYVKSGYLWNSGMFCFSTDVFCEECKKYSPAVYDAFQLSNNDAYEVTPSISIDYGVMENTEKAAVVPLLSSWSDLGNFDALYSVYNKDVHRNTTDSEYVTPDGENNLIISDRLISTIGISDTAIIDTKDVLLVCPRNQSQRVGEIVELLKEKNDKRADVHTTIHRPWGSYSIILKSDNYVIKRLFVLPHHRISLQYHNYRSEHWVVINGSAEVTKNNDVFVLQKGESTFVPAKELHRLANPNDIPLEVLEVQYGDILTEEDIVRYDDDYQRQ
jgi:mannose-1-phosphate guanylyltransferase/mannose-6-phosphate isomerase